MATITMPKMGYDMTQGKIVRWLKREGDRIEKGQPIAEIETDKVNIEIEAFTSGVLEKQMAAEGDTVPVGEPIAQVAETEGAGVARAAAPSDEHAAAKPAPAERKEEAAAMAKPAEAPQGKAGAGEGAEAPPNRVAAQAPPGVSQTVEAAEPAGEERVKASPVARRMAEEQGLQLEQIQGTGPGGRITKEDVERFLSEAVRRGKPAAVPTRPAPQPAAAAQAPGPPAEALPAPGAPEQPPVAAQPPSRPAPAAAPTLPGLPTAESVELSRMRRAIARVMAESKSTIPHFYATVEIDMSRAVDLRGGLNDTLAEEEKVSFNDFVMKAVALALRKFPRLNASYAGEKLNLYRQINVAKAVATEDGLITPVIQECDHKPLVQIARESRELSVHVREGRLRQEQYQGGTFTVSNMGMLGVEEFAAIINPPQAAILAVGMVSERPVVREGSLAIAHIMKATISMDHRVANGAEAAQFLGEVRRLLENPVRLI